MLQVNNELGLPLSLFRLEKRHRYAVLEMGASKQGDIAKRNVAGHTSSPTTIDLNRDGDWDDANEHIITNDELVTAYNEWTNRYNARHAEAIAAGTKLVVIGRKLTDPSPAAPIRDVPFSTLHIRGQRQMAGVALYASLFTPDVVMLLAPGLSDDPQRFDLAVALTRITFPYLALVSLETEADGAELLSTLQLGGFAAVDQEALDRATAALGAAH